MRQMLIQGAVIVLLSATAPEAGATTDPESESDEVIGFTKDSLHVLVHREHYPGSSDNWWSVFRLLNTETGKLVREYLLCQGDGEEHSCPEAQTSTARPARIVAEDARAAQRKLVRRLGLTWLPMKSVKRDHGTTLLAADFSLLFESRPTGEPTCRRRARECRRPAQVLLAIERDGLRVPLRDWRGLESHKSMLDHIDEPIGTRHWPRRKLSSGRCSPEGRSCAVVLNTSYRSAGNYHLDSADELFIFQLPKLAASRTGTGLELLGKGQSSEATLAFREALALFPREPRAGWHLARLAADRGDLSGALRFLKQHRAASPGGFRERVEQDAAFDGMRRLEQLKQLLR